MSTGRRDEEGAVRFVKTPDEVRRLQVIYSRPQFMASRSLTVLFETKPEAVSALLPPPLEPTPEAVGHAWLGEIGNSNCVGPFLGAAVYLRARYGDLVGDYCLTMPMSTDASVIFGRELYGEPKKVAKIIFERKDAHVWGSVERYDIRYLSLRGRMDGSGPAGRRQSSTFHFKYLPRPDGSGFDHPPLLVHVTTEINVQAEEHGRGELVFRDSPHDPVSDIPVVQTLGAVYTEGVFHTSGRVLCQADPEAFLPYAFGKMDSMDVVAEGTLMHAQAARRTGEGRGRWRETG
jgi:acetoacetate decarboxylase